MAVPLSLAPRTEAVVKYLPADLEILREGDFVRCAVTGRAIALDDLRYWDVARQVPFVSATEAFGQHPGNQNG